MISGTHFHYTRYLKENSACLKNGTCLKTMSWRKTKKKYEKELNTTASVILLFVTKNVGISINKHILRNIGILFYVYK